MSLWRRFGIFLLGGMLLKKGMGQRLKFPKRSLCERVRLKKKGKTGFLIYALLVAAASCLSTPVFAEGGDPLAVVGNLSTFIFSLIRAIGLILLGWGVVQVGLSFQSHDPSQRSQGFLTLAGGLVITFAKEILDLITGG